VDRVPSGVEPGHLVGEELRHEADEGGAEHPWIGKSGKRLQVRRKLDPAASHRKSGGEDAQIEPPAGEQADAGRDAQYLGNAHGPCCHARRGLANAAEAGVYRLMSKLPEPIPAATLVLIRPGSGSVPEILMMERAETMAFAAGALVFPGGRIDPQDHSLGGHFPQPDAAARIAAVRETIEETGIAPALLPPPDRETAATIRLGLSAGGEFGELLAEHRLRLDLDALTPFARWCPNFRETRRFDTLFYLAEAPAGAHPASADQTEAVRAFWASAGAVLEEIDAGSAHAIFPTPAQSGAARPFLLDRGGPARTRPSIRCKGSPPWVEERQGRKWVCIPEGIGYPVTAEPFETARRS
jgi:8-oxo-dGTP pyrophosphatase MutT (NUDIX family)